MSSFVFVENTKPHLFGIGNLVVGGTAPQAVSFKPGVNKVDVDVWEVLKKNPLIQAYVNSGDLKLDVSGDEPETAIDNFLEIPTKQAAKIIQNTFDKSALLDWKANENRTSVLRLIDAQLKSIEITEIAE